MPLPVVKLKQGIHVMHLFYRVDRVRWSSLAAGASAQARESLQALCAANNNASHPRIVTHANFGGKADLAIILYAAEGSQLAQMHRDLEAAFPAGTLQPVYTFLSITELSEYASTEDDYKRQIVHQDKLQPGTEAFDKRLAEMLERKKEYEHYRLYPELPDWEIMAFYPMSKRRSGNDNWYSLDFDARKKLMGGHARVGRRFANKVTQLITSCTGLDDWEWGVTLMSHQMDDLRDIVYEMRFDEVSARYGEFGPFYINLRMDVPVLWEHLKL